MNLSWASKYWFPFFQGAVELDTKKCRALELDSTKIPPFSRWAFHIPHSSSLIHNRQFDIDFSLLFFNDVSFFSCIESALSTLNHKCLRCSMLLCGASEIRAIHDLNISSWKQGETTKSFHRLEDCDNGTTTSKSRTHDLKIEEKWIMLLPRRNKEWIDIESIFLSSLTRRKMRIEIFSLSSIIKVR